MNSTPAERARIAAGYTLEAAARKLNLSLRYLRQIERQGNAPLKTAQRLARLYNCSGNLFLYSPGYLTQLGQGTATGCPMLPAPAGADTSLHKRSASRRYNPPRTPVLTVVPASENKP